MADITTPLVPTATTPGTQLVFAAATAGGDRVLWTPTGVLFVNNGHTAPITVTLTIWRDTAGTRDYIVPNGQIRMIDLIGTGQSSGGWINITYSLVTALTIALVDIDPYRS